MNYRKNKNTSFCEQLEEYLDVESVQNYIPLYTRFFELNDTNWNSINLDHPPMKNLEEKEDDLFMKDEPLFFKFSPLLDPLKYLTGTYESYDNTLPTIKTTPHPKMADVNNSSYVDGFFYYLSNRLLDQGFLHGTRFHGSFLAMKNDFLYDISEEVDHLEDSEFFHKNRGTLFELDQEYHFSDSRKNKDRVVLSDEPIELEFDSLDDISVQLSKDSLCYNLHAVIKQFPVQIIAMEKYEETLDSLLDDMNTEELTACLMQIIMTLIAYQKVYSFVHNDLHTNNIMYVQTELTHLTYCYQGVYYKVPTYGKLYKIIDYGRSIYSFQGNRFVSDSFHPEGDAGTQYNLEPYFNCAEEPIDANPSFDLCRLACSILEGYEEEEEIFNVLKEWTEDDAGESVLFKDGMERYPDFELYRMIARTVHKHTPIAQLNRPIFSQFQCEPCICMNIDSYTSN
jgi:hypothetical protein